VVLGWDSNDQLYDNVKFTGWHTAYPDAMVRLLPGDLPRPAPRRQHAAVPRRVRRQGGAGLPARHAAPSARARGRRWASGLSAAAEFEFFVFDETPESVREKNYATCST
jgi:glutamine synthetase